MYEQSSRIGCSVAGYFPEKFRWCLIEQFCQGSVQLFEQSRGLDTALYNNLPFTLSALHIVVGYISSLRPDMGIKHVYGTGSQKCVND